MSFLTKSSEKIKSSAPQTSRPFHITIGTASTKSFDLQNDLRMLRSALLYADKVKLCSHTMSHLYTMFGYSQNLNSYCDFLEKSTLLYTDEVMRKAQLEKLNTYRWLLRKKHKDKDELLAVNKFKRQIAIQHEGLREQYPALTQESELRGIEKAIKEGILELYTFESLQAENLITQHHDGKDVRNDSGISPCAEEIFEEYLNTVGTAVMNRTTYPLFDDTTGQLVKMGIKDGALSLSNIRVKQAKHSTLAANMFERLPDFGTVPLDQIIDIRKELKKYLDKFRRGISTYSSKIDAAPWEDDFASEADEIFIQEVKPTLLEIEELIKSGSYPIWHIGREVAKSRSLLGGGALGFFIDSPDSLPQYARVALGAAGPLVSAIREGIKSWLNEKTKSEGHTLYFYYRLRDEVERG